MQIPWMHPEFRTCFDPFEGNALPTQATAQETRWFDLMDPPPRESGFSHLGGGGDLDGALAAHRGVEDVEDGMEV